MPFTRELSALVARRESGEVRPWPVVETIQVNSICDEVIAPAQDLDPEIAEAAAAAAVTIASELGVTGVMAAELRFPAPRRLLHQRAGDAPAQYRPLDSGRLGDQPVRAAPACVYWICRWVIPPCWRVLP